MKILNTNFRMLWVLLVSVGVALGQPTECYDNAQCNTGFYCEPPGKCRECLRCEDLKRETLPAHVECVTSVTDCGFCFSGLVEDPHGRAGPQCVPAGSAAPPAPPAAHSPPSYLWLALAAGLVLLLLIVILVYYVLRNTDTLKILASTRTSLQSPCAERAAEPPPPPYHAQYEPVRPTSPPHDASFAGAPPLPNEESAAPFIKPGQWRRAREHDASQEARVYNNPHYVRGPDLPPSYNSALSEEGGPELHDESTMESPWTPAEPAPPPSVSSPAPGLGALLGEARAATVVLPPERSGAPPSKVLCIRQDSNNNSRGRSRDGDGPSSSGAAPPPPPPPAGAGPTLTFNFTVQQHNDLKLIRT